MKKEASASRSPDAFNPYPGRESRTTCDMGSLCACHSRAGRGRAAIPVARGGRKSSEPPPPPPPCPAAARGCRRPLSRARRPPRPRAAPLSPGEAGGVAAVSARETGSLCVKPACHGLGRVPGHPKRCVRPVFPLLRVVSLSPFRPVPSASAPPPLQRPGPGGRFQTRTPACPGTPSARQTRTQTPAGRGARREPALRTRGAHGQGTCAPPRGLSQVRAPLGAPTVPARAESSHQQVPGVLVAQGDWLTWTGVRDP